MSVEARATLSAEGSRNLVYTSAGHRSNIGAWLVGRRDFDLWINHYDVGESPHRAAATIYQTRPGGKFPNLSKDYQDCPDLFARYEAVLVMDDDILIDGAGITALFALRAEHDLWLMQPAFHPRGKVSHPITRWQPGMRLRFTSFVEVTCPLFRQDKLAAFMRVYDPALVGWGVDWWFLHVLGPELRGRVAIADQVPCINPHERGGRAIDRLQGEPERVARWQALRGRLGIAEPPPVTYGAIPLPLRERLGAKLGHAGDLVSHLTWLRYRMRRRLEALGRRLR